jgi:ABC-2 type transport system ATP-binding protein
MLDAGRLVALDTPAGIVSMARAEQRIRFRPSAAVDEHLFKDVPQVKRVIKNGDTVVVAGTGDLLQAVASTLARNQIIAQELRIEQSGLDDAFIELSAKHRPV